MRHHAQPVNFFYSLCPNPTPSLYYSEIRLLTGVMQRGAFEKILLSGIIQAVSSIVQVSFYISLVIGILLNIMAFFRFLMDYP